jgi:hypothetical protein
VDLAAVLSVDDLARACHEAGVRYETTPRQVEAVPARRPNTKGAGKVREVLRGDVHVTLSKLERRFLERLREAGLPLPQTNRPAGGRRIDCRWPEHRLTVELDGYRYHNSRHAWELDRHREREARARGDEFRPPIRGRRGVVAVDARRAADVAADPGLAGRRPVPVPPHRRGVALVQARGHGLLGGAAAHVVAEHRGRRGEGVEVEPVLRAP